MLTAQKKLGFGLMRLPKKGDEIDIPAVAEMADRFLAEGFTYFDTAYVYEGSEAAFRKAIAERHPHSSYTIADKLPSWHISPERPPASLFQESLDRCGVDYFDYYLLHNINGLSEPVFDASNSWKFVAEMKAEGKIRHVGFSFHGKPDQLEWVLEAHPEMEFVQLQINYLDWESPGVASRRCYEIARAHGKDIIVMEPVKGGLLAAPRPEAQRYLTALGTGTSAASYALRYAASLPGVEMVLSGMSAGPQMEDNLSAFRAFQPLTEEEQAAVAACRDAILSVETVPCTACRYCVEGCPAQIRIPQLLKAYNSLLTFGENRNATQSYREGVSDGGRASACIQCGQCEGVCPQHIGIIDLMQKISAAFD